MKASLLLALLALLALSGVARAQPAEERVVVVRVDVGTSGIDPAAVRSEIEKELGVRAATAPTAEALGTIDVRVTARTITVVFSDRDGQSLERTVDRPKDPKQDVEVIALLAGNLARDEARELAAGLAPKPKPKSETGSEPQPPPAEQPEPPPAKLEPPPAKPESPRTEPAAPKPAVAQDESQPTAAVNLSLFHPLAIFPDSHERLVHFELGLVYSRVGALVGAGVSAGALRIDRSLRGGVVSGVWTWTHGTIEGATVSGLFATGDGQLRGAEIATAFTLRRGSVEGAQIALVNVGQSVDGAQIGLVNVARRVRGAQVGLVNIAERVDGASIAPISLLKENRTQLQLWSDTTLIGNVGIKYSTGPLYTFVAAGGDPIPEDQRAVGAGAGLGMPIVRGSGWSLALDVLYRFVALEHDSEQHSTAYRAVAGWQLTELVELFAAAGVEHRVEHDEHVAYPYGAAGISLF